ncbi:hypothetical protein H9P43_005953 [Blastocladiella emersonii ATCC 22665]|nr:hypothetical protein H9P43_005953 [Blastocladiella emersonii ATCC 22665]
MCRVDKDPVAQYASLALSVAVLSVCLRWLYTSWLQWSANRMHSARTLVRSGTLRSVSRFGSLAQIDVSLLLYVAWLFFTLDQAALVAYLLSYVVACPAGCRNFIPPISPDCPAGAFVSLLIHFQTFGTTLFVSATVLRFAEAFSMLSWRRFILCRALLGFLALVCLTRFVLMLASDVFGNDESLFPRTRPDYDLFWDIVTFGGSGLLAIDGFVDIGALSMGLWYMRDIDRELSLSQNLGQTYRASLGNAAGVGASTGVLFAPSASTVQLADPTPGAPKPAASPTTAHSPTAGTAGTLSAPPPAPHPSVMRALTEERLHVRRVRVAICISLAILLTFPVLMFLPAYQALPLVVENTVNTTMLKVYAMASTSAIRGARRVSAIRRRMSTLVVLAADLVPDLAAASAAGPGPVGGVGSPRHSASSPVHDGPPRLQFDRSMNR